MWTPEAQGRADELRQLRDAEEGWELLSCSARPRLQKGSFRLNVQVYEMLFSITAFNRKN